MLSHRSNQYINMRNADENHPFRMSAATTATPSHTLCTRHADPGHKSEASNVTQTEIKRTGIILSRRPSIAKPTTTHENRTQRQIIDTLGAPGGIFL